MTARTLFITGTDTEVGKTWISCRLLLAARRLGVRAAGYKPVASGAKWIDGALVNDDAARLAQASNPMLTPAEVNPYVFAPPIAPHLAAADAGVRIERAVLDAGHDRLARAVDLVIVEGAGGWHVPLGNDDSYSRWVTQRGWPVLLVVGMRLGCINHALLSAEALNAAGCGFGWIANALPPRQPRLDENLVTLESRMPLRGFGSSEPADALDERLEAVVKAVLK